MVLVGPSGCGKTTALRMVAGLEDITSGTLRIGGKVVNDETPKERDIAMVFQNYALYPHMTVAENIGFALKLRKMPKPDIAAKVKETAEILGPDRVAGPQAGPAVRRAAAAGGDGPGDRARAVGVLDGRAAVQPGRQAAGADAGRGAADPAAHRRGHPVRDPRPGRGDDDGRPGRGDAGRASAAGRPPAGACTTTRTTCSSRRSSARRDEPVRGVDDRGRGGVKIGSQELALPEVCRDSHPGLARFAGKKVVVGLRPEHLPAATDGSTGPKLAGNVDLVEALGSELVIHFTIDARRVQAEGASSEDEDATAQSGEGVARVEPGTKVKVGEQDHVRRQRCGHAVLRPGDRNRPSGTDGPGRRLRPRGAPGRAKSSRGRAGAEGRGGSGDQDRGECHRHRHRHRYRRGDRRPPTGRPAAHVPGRPGRESVQRCRRPGSSRARRDADGAARRYRVRPHPARSRPGRGHRPARRPACRGAVDAGRGLDGRLGPGQL